MAEWQDYIDSTIDPTLTEITATKTQLTEVKDWLVGLGTEVTISEYTTALASSSYSGEMLDMSEVSTDEVMRERVAANITYFNNQITKLDGKITTLNAKKAAYEKKEAGTWTEADGY